ncbi:membrane protein insertase YidC [Gleimia hominis]|uniref:Membrane protein insertase YidC n=1 Tax=Gleimia hominis TaxID=595468 RepID=A0ABU3I8T2_9ACTO|nr:membrane protein insertase YidC [Gleimia hominis]MDT3766784.1 membrane protein insertase YidC [Gleimia hominis]
MWFDKLLYPFKVVVAWIMVRLHDLLVFLGMDDGPGIAWILSIVGLTVLVRIILIPLFFRQIRASRNMQLVQPELKKLQEKYKGKTDQASRQRQSEEMMALYRENGTSPFSSCLPILAQMPIFFALFRVLASTSQIAAGTYAGGANIGPLNSRLASDIENSTLFGAPLSASFTTTNLFSSKVVIVVMILLMVFTQFITMRQLTMKNMPASATSSDNPMMRSQRMMMYMMPAVIGVSGFFFQVGVLIYWFTTNLWTMGQQFWTIARMPTPGSDAYNQLTVRRRKEYVEWARPEFEKYDEQYRSLSDDDSQEREQLLARTLKSIKSQARKQKVPTKFPDDVTPEVQLSAYRELAFNEWDGLPDERWAKRFKPRAATKQRRGEQPKRLTKRERDQKAAAARRRAEREAQMKKRKKAKTKLSAQELEQRRQERRKQRREAGKKKKKDK